MLAANRALLRVKSRAGVLVEGVDEAEGHPLGELVPMSGWSHRAGTVLPVLGQGLAGVVQLLGMRVILSIWSTYLPLGLPSDLTRSLAQAASSGGQCARAATPVPVTPSVVITWAGK
jgi:hypothetical protein